VPTAGQPSASERPRRQERGLRRIESILDAAEQVIAEGGYEAATTNQIAARAGISPGSLYQYFANKAEVVEALAQRYLDNLGRRFDGVLGDDLAGLAALPMPELVARVVEPMVAFNLAHPATKALLAGGAVSPELATATAGLHEAMCDRVEALLGLVAPALAAADRHVAAHLSFQIFGGVLPAIMAAPAAERPRVVRELTTALAAYWSGLAAPVGAAVTRPGAATSGP
jgi:AcrR family transcriptional regulator